MRDERVKIVEDNEKHLASESRDFVTDEDDDGEGMADSDDEEKEFKDTLNKLKKAREGGADEDKNGDDYEDDDEDDDDSDYEYTGGDLALYDSALDMVDELLFIKEALENVNNVDSNYYQRLISQLSQDELDKFN